MNNFMYLLKEAWHNKRILYPFFILHIILSLVLSAAAILAPRYLIAELAGEARVQTVFEIAVIYFLITAAAGCLAAYVKAGYELAISRFRYYFIEKMKEKIMRVRYENLESPKYLNEFWRVTTATSDIEFGVQGILIQLFVLSANGAASLFYLSILGRLNILIVLLLIINIYLVYLFRSRAGSFEVETSRKGSPYQRRERYLTNVMGNLAYGKDIRIYGLSNFLLNNLMSNHKKEREIGISIQKRHYGADLAESVFSCVRDGVIYGYLIYCVLNGRLSIADFTMCFMTVATLTITLERVFEDVAFIKNDLFRIEEMRTFLALKNEEETGETIPLPKAEHYEITFQHVSFCYPGSEKNVYTDFNFTIKAGKKLAIVGINGAGKTTLVKLVTRLYDPTDGQILLNGKDIRMFRLHELLMKRNNECDDRIFGFKGRSSKLQREFEGISKILEAFRSAFVYGYIGVKALISGTGIGSFTMYTGAAATFSNATAKLLDNIILLRRDLRYLDEFVEFEEIPVEQEAGGQKDVGIHGSGSDMSLEFCSVSFRYPGTERDVLSSVSFKLNRGESLSIVGRNGAGKTTIIKLLSRLFKPTKGQILMNGVDIQTIDTKVYQELLAVVFQDFKIFEFSVEENVAAGREISEERLYAALESAGIMEKVKTLSKGVKTCVGKQFDEDGIEFSGGELQKLSIARALYKDSPVIVLDEPTAALDPYAEEEVYQHFHELTGGRMAVYISHRLSSCKFCGRIIFLDGGEITEDGSHEELMRLDGEYAKMFRMQASQYAV